MAFLQQRPKFKVEIRKQSGKSASMSYLATLRLIAGASVQISTKTTSAAIIAFCAIATVANAADMSVKAPRPMADVTYTYNWEGMYLGGNVGWDFVRSNGTSSKLDPNSFGTARVQSGSNSWDGIIGGGQIGYNWMVGPSFVWGIEADLSAVDAKLNFSTTSVDGTSYSAAKVDAFGTLRGRAGVIVGSNWLLFGTGGLAWSHGNISHTQGPCAIDPTCATSPVALGTVNSATFSRFGWTVGGGVEVGFAKSWSAKLEYLYADLGSFSYNYPSFNRTLTSSVNEQVVRAGLNYHFGGPAVPRY